MTRCHFCRGTIWPWQRRGWYVFRLSGRTLHWHSKCLVGDSAWRDRIPVDPV